MMGDLGPFVDEMVPRTAVLRILHEELAKAEDDIKVTARRHLMAVLYEPNPEAGGFVPRHPVLSLGEISRLVDGIGQP